MALLTDLFYAGAWTLFAAIIGIVISVITAVIIPKIVDRLTPHINEEKEIQKGNVAVATYMGQVVSGVTISVGLIIAAAIIAGIHGA